MDIEIASLAALQGVLRGMQIWFLTVFAIYILTSFVVSFYSFKRPRTHNIFLYIFLGPLFVGAMFYLIMGLMLPNFEIPLLIRFIYSLLIWTAAAMVLGLAASVGWFRVMVNVILAAAWALFYVAACVAPWDRWAYYIVGTLAYFVLMFSTLMTGSIHARRLTPRRHYMFLAIWANIIWFLYPVFFGLYVAGIFLSPYTTLIVLSVLDVLLVLGLTFMTLGLGKDWDVPGLVARFKKGPRFLKKKEHAEWDGIGDDNAPGIPLQPTAVPVHSGSPPAADSSAPAGHPAGAQTASGEHGNEDVAPAAV